MIALPEGRLGSRKPFGSVGLKGLNSRWEGLRLTQVETETRPDSPLMPEEGGNLQLAACCYLSVMITKPFFFTFHQRVVKGGMGMGCLGPPNCLSTNTSAFVTNTQSRFASDVLGGVLGA